MIYYNEFDPHAAEWLRNLMAAGLIPAGVVDERSIVDVQAEDLAGFTQCHFFAGIGGWPLALQLAGWPEDRDVWTGSCPCQPFSNAGKRQGTKDPRHLWPEFRRLIAECRPAVAIGEQTASRAGRAWLAGVRADLEALGYAVGGADLCAAGVGAPHVRQRLFWVGDTGGRGRPQPKPVMAQGGVSPRSERSPQANGPSGSVPAGRLADGAGARRGRPRRPIEADAGTPKESDGRRDARGLADDGRARLEERGEPAAREERAAAERGGPAGFWSDYEIIPCADGKARRVESGLFPLVDGLPFRLADGRTREGASRAQALRGLGNAIVPQVAATFVRAYLSALGG